MFYEETIDEDEKNELKQAYGEVYNFVGKCTATLLTIYDLLQKPELVINEHYRLSLSMLLRISITKVDGFSPLRVMATRNLAIQCCEG